MNFKKYHASRNLLSEKYENRSINGLGAFTIDNAFDLWIGEVVAGQTYTISNMNAVYGFFTEKPLINTGVTYNSSREIESSGTAVVTTPSGCTWIAVRVSHNADNAMLNSGSQPLPYEPYSSEVWHDTPHYIHNTSTDTITTLPADIYPNATTATVGLKGNTTQSGTPTPENPIMPEGCGDLETSGTKTGQYKISISSASITTPVYLGVVETVRKIKKLVFDGTENIELNTLDKNRLMIQAVYTLPQSGTTTATNIICTHLMTLDSAPATSLQQGIAMRYNGTDILFGVPFSLVGATAEDSGATVRTKVKSYLAAQYANGTPMTIWYVLAAETTGTVNEPLMRIGDYADTLSNVSIPVTAGGDTLSVGTTVQPSEVTVNYKGWHPVADVHEFIGNYTIGTM